MGSSGGRLAAQSPANRYQELVALFREWRDLEQPPHLDGAPDYTAGRVRRDHERMLVLRDRLYALDRSGFTRAQEVDWHLVRAEMNGFDFNVRVLRPWQRDPAFYRSLWTYQSDTPAHEGPTHHALVELWSYDFPLARDAARKLSSELATIPPLLEQARANLTGNAAELWEAGIGDLRDQVTALDRLQAETRRVGGAVEESRRSAHQATADFVAWLEREASKKDGPSGIGREHYTWSLRHVHLVPSSWQEEVSLLRRELDRAHSTLRLEEHRNRDLPPLRAISSPEEFEERAHGAVTRYLDFLRLRRVLEVEPFMDGALRERIGSYVPPERRNFFQTAIHFEPITLWTHFYHWWDLARMELAPHPSPIRRGPLLYNTFDSRAEGLATGVEEMFLHAGLYDDNPRAREVVWILLAQRAARGLGSLYVHDNQMTMKEARDFHVEWTPRGWMREDLDLLGFEQLLYLRQPGYGTSYVTGKALLEGLLKDRSKQLGDDFDLAGFFAEIDAAGVIPMSLLRYELTGLDDEIRSLLAE